MGWDYELSLGADDGSPLFLRIARAVIADLRRGRLRPGEPLPGSRTLAAQLGVHRNTVIAAYDELAAEGWITQRPARGTFVQAELPEVPARSPRKSDGESESPGATRAGFELGAAAPAVVSVPPGRGVLRLLGGAPDLRLVPVEELARAYRRALLGRDGRQLLDYAEPTGDRRLRQALCEWLAVTRGVRLGEDAIAITRGSQEALYLAARAIVRPGDAVAVEAWGYRPAWEALRLCGARLCPIPVDERGADVAALESLCRRERVRAVYLTPHHQYPTTVTLQAERRLRLLALARSERLAVFEDDYDHEFHYDGRPVLPLLSADTAGVVVYVGTLSKIVAPGLRLGFLAAPRAVIERATAYRALVDRQGDQVLERAVALLLEDGTAPRHVRRARRAYRARREALATALRAELGGALAFTVPPGGIALWARTPPEIDVEAWAERALSAGVAVQTARRFALDGKPRSFLRLGFAACDEDELREAVRRLARALPAGASGGAPGGAAGGASGLGSAV